MNDMIEEVKTHLLNDKTPTQIRGWLQFTHDLKEKEARTLVKAAMNDLGMATTGSKIDMEALVATIREHHGTMKRAELAILCAENSGCTVSTANHHISAVKFAMEWSKQESEAY